MTEHKDQIEATEKAGLQKDITKIEERLAKNEITKNEAQKLKEEAAKKKSLEY